MHKSGFLSLLLLGGLLGLAGCGSGGLGSSLSGGSVPIGGRAVSGIVLLPDTTPVANAAVTVRSLPAGTLIQTTTTDGSGRFLATVPTNSDMDVVVMQQPSNTLEVVVPQSSLASNPGQPLDIGQVNASTTIVAAAIKLEQAPAPEDADSIVENQYAHLYSQVHDADYSLETQKQIISDPKSLQAQALTLIVPTANTELSAFAASPNSTTANAVLNGLLGYVRCAHSQGFHLSETLRNNLINAQLKGKLYTPDAIASALQSAGVDQATATQVSSASARERTELTALSSLGNGISPFEALIIGADVNTHGGFQLSQKGLNTYLSSLLAN